MPLVSVIIPTLDRSECLRDCLESLWAQTFQDFEIIKVTEVGPLAKLRNEGAKRSKGKYLVFIDDDTFCRSGWLQEIVRVFEGDRTIAGVTGPCPILGQFRRNRDIIKWPWKWLYDFFFCYGRNHLPGHITKAGAWTTGATEDNCTYEGEVQFLEACNMAYRTDIFNKVGGFDERYEGIGDWSEPDLSFRIRELGYKLWFSRDAVLEHRPSKSGAFKKRDKQAPIRLKNYELFSKRWVNPCWQHTVYKGFIRFYYALKTVK